MVKEDDKVENIQIDKPLLNRKLEQEKNIRKKKLKKMVKRKLKEK